jgi:hypothetical protein
MRNLLFLSALSVLLVFASGVALAQQGYVGVDPETLVLPGFPGGVGGQFSLTFISGDSSTNRFVFEIALDDMIGQVLGGCTAIRGLDNSGLNNIGVLSASVVDNSDDFFTEEGISINQDWVYPICHVTTAYEAGVLEIEFEDTPTQINFHSHHRAECDQNFTEPCSVFATVITEIQVSIDIKPGSDPNSINLSSSGVIPVAILSSDTFDATTVDPVTVALAGATVKLVGKSDKYLAHEEDVNEDGLMDLVCQVYTAQFMIEPGESLAVLEAETFDGTPIRGEDSIRVVSD